MNAFDNVDSPSSCTFDEVGESDGKVEYKSTPQWSEIMYHHTESRKRDKDRYDKAPSVFKEPM